MTNAQAQGYAVVALSRLIAEGDIRGNGTRTELCRMLDRKMYDLMDIMFEEEAEEKAGRILHDMIK